MVAANTRTLEQVTVVTVPACEVCGQDLRQIACRHHERRTRIDIVFEKVVEHVDAEVKQCPGCDSIVKGVFPGAFHGPVQYGDGLKAFVVNLLVCQMVSLNRAQKLLKSMVGEVLAEASLLKFMHAITSSAGKLGTTCHRRPADSTLCSRRRDIVPG